MVQLPWTESAWKYPIADDGFMIIGRIAVMWTSIEVSVNHILKELHRLDNDQFAQFVGKQAFDSKISTLQKAARRSKDAAIRTETREACVTLKGLAEKRNAAIHGVWGWRPCRRVFTKGPFVGTVRLRDKLPKAFVEDAYVDHLVRPPVDLSAGAGEGCAKQIVKLFVAA